MPYRYLEDIAIADVAFEAWGETKEELFLAASDATVGSMVGDLDSIVAQERRQFQVGDTQIDMLLFQVLQEILYFKDAEKLLLRVQGVRITHDEGGGPQPLKPPANR